MLDEAHRQALTDRTFLLYCAKHYDNRNCHDVQEFLDDIKRIKYVKKIATRYVETGELKERLILNHLTVLYNVFGPHVVPRILYLKMRENFSVVKPFLVMMGCMPEVIWNVGGTRLVYTDEVALDQGVVDALRRI